MESKSTVFYGDFYSDYYSSYRNSYSVYIDSCSLHRDLYSFYSDFYPSLATDDSASTATSVALIASFIASNKTWWTLPYGKLSNYVTNNFKFTAYTSPPLAVAV